jgi:quinoprotein relay system zinc metallohydrolase 2
MRISSRAETIESPYRPNARPDIAVHKIIALQHCLRTNILPFLDRASKVFGTAWIALTASAACVFAEPLPVVEVAQGVFAFQGRHDLMTKENGGAIANLGFIVGETAVAVVDTGGTPEQGRRLLETVRSITDCPVRYVVLTHMHPDHVFGSAAFSGPDVAFVGHARLNAALEQRFGHYLAANAPALGPGALDGAERPIVARPVEERAEIDLGGRIIVVEAWPVSHTDNDLTVYDPTTRTLFSGDLVFLEHLPSLDGSLRGWQRTLERLAAIPAERVVPGHGPVPSHWPEALEPSRRYFEVLARDVKAAIDAGRPLSEAARTAGRSEAPNWTLFDEFNARNATAAFAELEWE